MKSIFDTFLDLLEVKHTESFSNRYFNEHPHKFNLFGLSKMLSDYGIENGASEITDKESNITNISTPFIAQFGGGFVTVYKVDSAQVSFIWEGVNHVLPVDKFIESWTGVVLLAETSEKSGEPDYKEHRKTETLNLLKKAVLISALGLTVILTYIYNSYYINLGISLLLSVNIVGIYICWLLLLKQLRIQSRYADKICSLFKQKDCNNVLESKAAKLLGIISMSEIGLGYFSANVLLLLFSPASLSAIALLNILTLPFTIWSVWYQGVKAKQWCSLCIIVLALLWAVFLINLLFGYIPSPVIAGDEVIYFQLIIAGSTYIILVLGLNILAPKLNAAKTTQSLRQSINSLKVDEDVFSALLKKQPYYETDDCDSIIRFGNPDSKLRLTVFSNPYCNPCAKMHQRIEELLKKTSNGIFVRYILSSFTEALNSTNKYLIAVCQAENNLWPLPKRRIAQIFSEWFEKGKSLKDDYFKDIGLDMENPAS